jgi:hypothetical protein
VLLKITTLAPTKKLTNSAAFSLRGGLLDERILLLSGGSRLGGHKAGHAVAEVEEKGEAVGKLRQREAREHKPVD